MNKGIWTTYTSTPPDKAQAIDLPAGFGFDKFRLMVHEQYAAVPESDSTGTTEASALFEADNTNTMESSGSEAAIVDQSRPAALKETSQTNPGDDNIVNEVIDTFLATESGVDMTYTSNDKPGANSTAIVQQ